MSAVEIRLLLYYLRGLSQILRCNKTRHLGTPWVFQKKPPFLGGDVIYDGPVLRGT